MGKLIYGTNIEFELEDRLLAHLKVVVTGKLAKQESFLMNWHPPKPIGLHRRISLWVNPSIPLQFFLYGSKPPQINPRWIEALEETCHSIRGLEIISEKEVEDYLARAQARKANLLRRQE